MAAPRRVASFVTVAAAIAFVAAACSGSEAATPEPVASASPEASTPVPVTPTPISEPTTPPEPTAATVPESTAAPVSEPTVPPEPTAPTAPEPTAPTEPTPEATAAPTPAPVPAPPGQAERYDADITVLPVPEELAGIFAPPNLDGLIAEGKFDYPPGIENITDPMLRQAVWQHVNIMNASIDLLNDPAAASWQRLRPFISTSAVTDLEADAQASRDGGLRIDYEDGSVEANTGVRVLGELIERDPNNAVDTVDIEYCQHIDRILVDAGTGERTPLVGTRIQTYTMTNTGTAWEVAFSQTVPIAPDEFVACPGHV